MPRKESGATGGFSLFTPGPVNISPEVRAALAGPMMHHRSPEFQLVWRSLGESLKAAFVTTGSIVTLTSSATGAMEAVVANLFSPGDHVLVPVNGKFSERWAEICGAYGIHAVRLEQVPGESPSPEAVRQTLKEHRQVTGVLATQCETSTGSLSDIKSLAAAIRDVEAREGRRIIMVSDSTTSFLVDELRTDAWGIDAVVGASQKGLLSPPGLAFVALGERAQRCCETGSSPRYYLDFRKYLARERPPFTPAVSLVLAAKRSLERILDLGLESVWKANGAAALALRSIIRGAGFRQVARNPSSAVVAFWVDDLDADELLATLAEDHGITIAQGQGSLKGKVLRVSGIGKSPRELLFFAGAFEATLAKLGRRFESSGLTAELQAILEDDRVWE